MTCLRSNKPRACSARSTRLAVSCPIIRRIPMTKFALLGVAALLSAMAAAAATAQEVIYNPGYCAQFYPNANCQNKGPNNPYTGDYQRRLDSRDAYVFGTGPCTAGA